jgi:hypothetical protein
MCRSTKIQLICGQDRSLVEGDVGAAVARPARRKPFQLTQPSACSAAKDRLSQGTLGGGGGGEL